MCCWHCSGLYRKLPFLHAFTGFIEMIFGLVRLGIFFTPRAATDGTLKRYSGRYVAAFIIDWISSIVPTLIGLFTILVILVILFKLCACCCSAYSHREGGSGTDINTSGMLRKIIRQKALRRFLIIDCNCPCYKARPRLRFQVRFGILCAFFILRIVSISLYAASMADDNDGGTLAIVCAISLIFLFNTLCLDLYRYCVWWHYTPQDDTRCHLRSKKHERYIPYHMIGANRDARTLGDQPCTETPCHERTLDHIAVFHGYGYQPQDRWRDIPKPPPLDPEAKKSKIPCLKPKDGDNQPHYIGFHTTDPGSAISIAHSEFRPGKNGWIGAGVYFARSVAATEFKAKSQGGARIITEIRMGKVYEVEREVITRGHSRFNAEIFNYAHYGHWRDEYDTCYMIQSDDCMDEFAIKDPVTQIIKWAIVIEEGFDPKVERYELSTEFDSTKCGCI